MATPIAPYLIVDPFQALLQAIPALGSLPLATVEEYLAGAVHWQRFAPREAISEQGQPVDFIHYVRNGRVFLERIARDAQGRQTAMLRQERGPGSLLGLYDLLYGQPSSVRTRALSACTTISVEASAMSRLVVRFPEIQRQIVPSRIIGRLRTIPMIGRSDLITVSFLADGCSLLDYDADQPIYRVGERAENIYFIDTGQAELTLPGGRTLWIGNGSAFGYLQTPNATPVATAAIYDHQAVARTKCTVIRVERKLFTDITTLSPERTGLDLQRERENTLTATAVFKDYSVIERQRLLGYASHYHIPIRRPLFQPGVLGDSMWILMPEGRAVISERDTDGQQKIAIVRGPRSFNEMALRRRRMMSTGLYAEPNSQWLQLTWADFQQFVKDAPQNAGLEDRLHLSEETRRELARAEGLRRFSWLRDDEQIEELQRRHWLVYLRKITPALTLGLVLSVPGVLLTYFLADSAEALGTIWAVIAIAVLAVFVWGTLDYWNDFIAVTNQRLIHQEKIIYVTERREEAPLEQVQNIDTESDFWGNFWRYGTLRVQTAATKGKIEFDYMPSPNTMRERIFRLRGGRETNQRAEGMMLVINVFERQLGVDLQYPKQVIPEGSDSPKPRQHLFWPFAEKKPATGPDDRRMPDIVWRKHWLILLKNLTIPAVLLVVLTVFLVVQTGRLLANSGDHVGPLTLLAAFVGIGLITWMLWVVADWRNDTYELRGDRIIDVEKKPLFFAEKRRTANLKELQNIDFDIPGILYYFLDFGNVRLQTAATDGDFTFDWVPNPRAVVKVIQQRREMLQERAATQQATEIEDWIQLYDRLRQQQ